MQISGKIKPALWFVLTVLLLELLLYVLRGHIGDTFYSYRHSLCFFLGLFLIVVIYLPHYTAVGKNYMAYSVMAVLLFLGLGYLISRITLASDRRVTVSVEARLSGSDFLQVYYLPVNEAAESEKNSIRKKVPALRHFQTVAFEIPDTIRIKTLRFDLGDDSTFRHIGIGKIFIRYNDQTLVLYSHGKEGSYLSPNEYVKASDKGLWLQPVNGRFDPFMYSADITEEYSALLASEKKLALPFGTSFILVFASFLFLVLYSRQEGSSISLYTVTSCFFVLLIFLPSINQLFGFYENKSNEQRTLISRPEFNRNTALDFPKLYEAYFNDNFGFKSQLIEWNGKIRYHLFRSSIIPQKAAIGKEQWLYLNGYFYEITQDISRTNLYSSKELKDKVMEWEERKRSLESDSIGYYKAIWPDKHYIYPEYMPFNMTFLLKDTLSRTDQTIAFLKQQNSPVEIIDVRARLMEEKKHTQVYFKYDSHWNSYGAFIGYTALLSRISENYPAVKPHSTGDYAITWETKQSGDLANMLGIETKEPHPVFRLKQDSSEIAELPVNDFPASTLIYENKKASSNLSILIYRDSYTTALIPFLQPHFKKIVLLWNVAYSKEMVERVKPDIVVEGYVTRYFR